MDSSPVATELLKPRAVLTSQLQLFAIVTPAFPCHRAGSINLYEDPFNPRLQESITGITALKINHFWLKISMDKGVVATLSSHKGATW